MLDLLEELLLFVVLFDELPEQFFTELLLFFAEVLDLLFAVLDVLFAFLVEDFFALAELFFLPNISFHLLFPKVIQPCRYSICKIIKKIPKFDIFLHCDVYYLCKIFYQLKPLVILV